MAFPAGFPLFSAWQQVRQLGYGRAQLRGDLLAGLTVGIIAIPLAMALAIAVGAPPQHGLYTVLLAAPLIALTGGSRFNISGPTAAFVVILLPIVQQHGLSGLLICTMLAGLLMISLGVLKAGKLIQFVPYPVTLGFTAGIGIVIAGLSLIGVPGTAGFVSKWYLVLAALEAGQLWLVIAVLASSLLAIAYVWRFVEVAYFKSPPAGAQKQEAPLAMLIPAWGMVLATIWFGFDTSFTVGSALEAAQQLVVFG